MIHCFGVDLLTFTDGFGEVGGSWGGGRLDGLDFA